MYHTVTRLQNKRMKSNPAPVNDSFFNKSRESRVEMMGNPNSTNKTWVAGIFAEEVAVMEVGILRK
jgi:hypothetical protein